MPRGVTFIWPGALSSSRGEMVPHHGAGLGWLLDRADSPWYPSLRLYRQSRPAEWSDVIAAVARDLASAIARRSGSNA